MTLSVPGQGFVGQGFVGQIDVVSPGAVINVFQSTRGDHCILWHGASSANLVELQTLADTGGSHCFVSKYFEQQADVRVQACAIWVKPADKRVCYPLICYSAPSIVRQYSLTLLATVLTPTVQKKKKNQQEAYCSSKPLLMPSHAWFRCASTTGTALSTLVGSSWSQRGSGTTSVPWPAALLRPSTWCSLMSPRMWRPAASRSAPLLLHSA